MSQANVRKQEKHSGEPSKKHCTHCLGGKGTPFVKKSTVLKG